MNSFIRHVVIAAMVLPQMASACFDTYLFLNKSSMVYPKGQFVIEGSGEYIIPKMRNAESDFLSGGTNVYYGFSKRFSLQVGVSSSEKIRSAFAFDQYGIRGVFGIIQNYNNFYNLDVILEHASPFDMSETAFELSAPSIFHTEKYTFVVHPVTAFGRNVNFSVRGHCGAFYRLNTIGIVGLGAEYASAQTGTKFGRRLVKGETGTSLFLGSHFGAAYLQNEFIKGWGEGGNDFGFAATVKFTLPSLVR
jgi:hypothetical protein